VAIETIIDNRSARLVYHPDAGIIHHEFRMLMRGDAFREVLNRGLEALERYRATKWLSDDRRNSSLTADDSTWAETVWFPRAQAAGWKHWAIVLPENLVGQMNMKRFIEHNAAQGVNVRVFTDPDAGLRWLEGQPGGPGVSAEVADPS
jgi:hypothetical protein